MSTTLTSRVFVRNLLLASAVALVPMAAHADEPTLKTGDVPVATTSGDIETSKYSFVGEVNANETLVRSGPSENDYQVLKLAKGTRLTVVGMRFDWLKIAPPDGAFCLVPEAYIDKGGDGTTGRVINKGAPVRVGSALTQAMHRILPRQLDPGEQVKILGETPTQEFYKIAPPRDVFMYVDKKFVNPVQRTDGGAIANQANANPVNSNQVNADPAPVSVAQAGDGASTPQTVQPKPGTDTQLPDGAQAKDDNKFVVKSKLPEEGKDAVANGDANTAAIRALQERLSKLEDRYAAAGQLELSQQPLEALSKDYDALIADKQLPPNARRVAEYRAGLLKVRSQALAEYVDAKKAQDAAAQKQRDLKAEQDELAAQVAATKVKHFAAVGRLMSSALQVGDKPLYRLVDPATGHLVIYIRAAKAPVADGLDKFIALNGQVVQDDATHMTYLQPDNFEVVDPKQLNTKIFADYAPPSMATSNVTGEASAR